MKVSFSGGAGLTGLVEKWRKQAQTAMAEQALRDSQQYCLYMTGALRGSGETHSKPSADPAVLSWQTPYARRRYYEPCVPRTPGTTIMWVDTAKAAHLSDWLAIGQKAMG